MTPHRGKEKPKFAYSKDLLLQDLQSDNMFFDGIVDMIPAKIYVAGNSGDDYNPKYFKGQAKESKEARRAKAKQAKRAKLDPNLAETTTAANSSIPFESVAFCHDSRSSPFPSIQRTPRI